MRRTVYDIEMFKNLFLIVFKDIDTGEYFVFEISKRKDDRHKLIVFLQSVKEMIGFNNVGYDYPLLHLFIRLYLRNLKGSELVTTLYKKSQELIANNNRWANAVRRPRIIQRDLFLINHYDNYNKRTSLKILEFNMMMDTIQELPFAFNKILTDNEIIIIVEYCHNDVEATYEFYLRNIKSIKFREKMSNMYKYNLSNYNDVKIGGVILLKALSKGMGISEQEIKPMRTKRPSMAVSDIIFNYINFHSIELNTLLNWWKKRIIYKTKGQFNEIPLDEVQELLPYCNNTLKKKKLKNLNIIYNRFQFDFGTGGLHGACYPGVFESDDEYDIYLIDASSYYPMLAYYNGLHPLHIPKDIFLDVIKMLYDQRMKGKDEGDFETVDGIKLALNGYLYGNSNNDHSFMKDPQFMMSICINGQLLLTMIAEQCMLHDIQVIQVNTDGVMVRCHKNKRNILDKITDDWMELTKLKLDYDYFDLVVQRDVNNYLARYTNGEIKYKGAFDFEYAENGDWHKNFSMMIVAKALKAHFVDGINPEMFIKNHNNMYDFFLRTKFDRTTKLVARTYNEDWILTKQELLQNVTRYYISKNGQEFIKIMKPLKDKTQDREFQVEDKFKCREMNVITIEKLRRMKQDLNYDYYIQKTQQIINVIEDYIPVEELSFIIIDDTK